jgi:nucleotide-binding universal stress UspA family protein
MPARVVLGLDGSAHARRAEAFLATLRPAGRVRVVRVVEPVGPVTTGLLPAPVRNRILGEAARLEAARRRVAQRDVDGAARRLKRAGWRATAEVRQGVPLEELMKSVRAARADMLVVGARGVGGAARLLLGSVADGALRHAPCAVLVIR